MKFEHLNANLRLRKTQLLEGKTSENKTALVVQGGGMRGIYSMAALMAIEEAGLGGAFDHVYGSSAGAINGAYLLAEQAKLAVSVYLDDISNKKFVDFFRVKKIVDIDYLVDGVLKSHKLLDVKTVMNSLSELHIILTDFVTSEAVEVTSRKKDLELFEAIRATAAMPILYNKIVPVNGGKYIDGGLRDAVPLLRAIKNGCTDIVIVLTREPSFRRKKPNLFMRLIELLFIKDYPSPTKELILAEDNLFNQTMDTIINPESINFDGRIAVVYPSDMKRMVSRTTNDRSKLLDCALMARNDMRNILGLEPKYDNPFE